VDEYQILEAKAYGADLILLIAAVLTREEIKSLSQILLGLALKILLRGTQELEKNRIMPTLDMIESTIEI
jgi:indole-3-glycerol phosphate synthase